MRQPTIKDLAEYFRLALEAGLCREIEIEAWADKMIIEANSPTPDWLLNLSIERERSKTKVLESVPGESDQISVWNLVLAKLGIAARTKQMSQERVVRILFRWAVDRVMPEEYVSWAYTLDDGFDGHKAGWFFKSQFDKDFEDFFLRFQSLEPLLPEPTLQAYK
jgi:hypothetical protein